MRAIWGSVRHDGPCAHSQRKQTSEAMHCQRSEKQHANRPEQKAWSSRIGHFLQCAPDQCGAPGHHSIDAADARSPGGWPRVSPLPPLLEVRKSHLGGLRKGKR